MPFPLYISKLPPFEEPDPDTFPLNVPEKTLIRQNLEFVDNQRMDFLAALDYVAKKIADNPRFSEISPNELEEIILKTHKIVSKTVAKKDHEGWEPGVLRNQEVTVVKESTPESDYRKYNLEFPGDIFLLQVFRNEEDRKTVEKVESNLRLQLATNYIKFHCKMFLASNGMPLREQLMLIQGLEKILLSRLDAFNYDVQEWYKTYFPQGSLSRWFMEFAISPENQEWMKSYLSTTGLVEDQPERYVTKCFRTSRIFTEEEKTAAQSVIAFFPLAEELPGNLKKLTQTLCQMLKAKEKPIKIACHLFRDMTVDNHYFMNGTGRVARILMNGILLHFKRPALQLDSPPSLKQQYYLAVEASVANPTVFEDFIRDQMSIQVKRNIVAPTLNSLCHAARDGDIVLTIMLLDKGIDPNGSLAEGWTPLHYACALQKGEKKYPFGRQQVANYLVSHGADMNQRNDKGKTPLDLIKDAEFKNEVMLSFKQRGNMLKPARIKC